MVGEIYFTRIKKLLGAAKTDTEVFEAIVNAPFHDKIRATHLDLGIIVLLQVNGRDRTIDRIALSDTEPAAGAVQMSEKPFKEIRIPLHYDGNLIAKAIDSSDVQCVTDWKFLFAPALSPRAARFNQAGAGIEYSCVYPLKARGGGAIIFSFFQESKNIGPEHRSFMGTYASLADATLARLG